MCAAVSGSAESQLPDNGRFVICTVLPFFLLCRYTLESALKAEPRGDGAGGLALLVRLN